ncbi:hypothetical protein [Brochothrix thermosphacta]|uniref:hypothetical protein n=1 Tax=Brochothrix thermosphacta TaxID=2756 RepID=UPI00265CA7FF|nr:hypothetical protein [Brochothrix thermosphacta]WKK68317.1 hypothetical protein Q0G00_08315 [Brochothrix thermosphacta]
MKFIEVTKARTTFWEEHMFFLSVDKIIFILEAEGKDGGTYIEYVGGYEENGIKVIETYEEVKELIKEATK